MKNGPIPAAVGARIVPGGLSSSWFRRSAPKALKSARLGSELSSLHYYLRDGATFDDVEWSKARGRANWNGGHEVTLPRSAFVVRGDTPYILLYRGENQHEVLVEQEFAEYIRSGG